MALTVTPININPAGGSTAPAQRANLAALKASLTSITIGVAGDYTPGGAGTPLTPAQLGMDSQVVAGVVTLRTPGGAGTAVQGILDCSSPGAPKLKFNTAGGEVAAAGVAGLVCDVLALGM